MIRLALCLLMISCGQPTEHRLENQIIMSHNIARHAGYSSLGPISSGELVAGESRVLTAQFLREACYILVIYGERGVGALNVVVTAPDGDLVATDQGSDSSVVLSFCTETSGEHQIMVSTEQGGGEFQMAFWSSEAESGEASQGPGNTLVIGRRVTGTLVQGTRFIDYSLRIQQSRRVTIELESRDFDTYLYLFLNGSELARDDDGGSGLNSRIEMVLQPGTYSVRVGSFGNQGQGQFTLRAY